MAEDKPVAVAIRYQKTEDKAPKVVAKGILGKADRIREIAKQNNVPIMRNVALAQALMRVDVGEEIPEDLYDAVAEVLNFVYALAEKTKT